MRECVCIKLYTHSFGSNCEETTTGTRGQCSNVCEKAFDKTCMHTHIESSPEATAAAFDLNVVGRCQCVPVSVRDSWRVEFPIRQKCKVKREMATSPIIDKYW